MSSSANIPSDAPMVTEAMINEWLKNRLDPEWYLSFLGKTAKKEPIFWEWAETLIQLGILDVSSKAPAAFSHPLLGAMLRDLGRNCLIAGYFMGMRKYETSLESMFQLTHPLMPNDRPKTRKKRNKKIDDNTLGGTSEIGPDDLAP